ncbi:hypothetical protein BDW22DRAFT_1428064 [Trametopsis cervina]|nr:hypothetical protein BDW22DRAFT_1428064 [Trametopsis cervina]
MRLLAGTDIDVIDFGKAQVQARGRPRTRDASTWVEVDVSRAHSPETEKDEDDLALRREKNALLPVMRLPIDVLILIFELLPADPDMQGLYRTVDPDSMAWIAFTQVCQYWRNIALNLPSLWTSIHAPGISPSWCHELLSRSYPLPLHITVHDDSGLPSCPAQQFLSHVLTTHPTRIRTLSIRGMTPAHLLDVLSRCAQPLPALRSLSVVNEGRELVEVPLGVLAKLCGALQELCVAWVRFSVSNAHDALKIGTLRIVAGSIPRYTSCLCYLSDVLSAFPALETFALADATSVGTCAKGTVIRLPPSTKNVAFRTCSPNTCVEVASHLCAPSAALSYTFNESISLDTLKRLLFPDSKPVRCARMMVVDHFPCRGVTKMELEVGRAPGPPSDGNTPVPPPDVRITIGNTCDRTYWRMFCESVGTEDLEDLTVEDETRTSAEKWRALRPATRLRRLRVIGSAVFSLLQLFHLDVVPVLEGTDAGVSAILFPQLEALSIIEREERPGQLGEKEFAGSEMLLRCLQVRRERGTPIRDLKLPARFMGTKLAGELRSVVEKVGSSSVHYY